MIIPKNFIKANISEIFTSEQLSQQELATIHGGIRRKGKSRDKDILDVEDEDE